MVPSGDFPSLGFRWAAGEATTQQRNLLNRRCWEMQGQPSGHCEHLLFFASLRICSVPGRGHNIVDFWLFFLFPPSGRRKLCGPLEKQNIKCLDKEYEAVLLVFLCLFVSFFSLPPTHMSLILMACNYGQPMFKQHKNNQNLCPYRSYY